MAVSLVKGGNVPLNREAPGLKNIIAGIGWDTRQTAGDGFDLDSSLFLVKEDGKVRSDSDFIFFNNLESSDGSVEHTGDNTTGAGDGDDEQVKVNLKAVSSEITRIVLTVTIHDAENRRQNFGMIQSAFIRVVDVANDEEIVRYDLSEDFSTETAMIFGEIYRHGLEWNFKAIGQGFAGGLSALATHFGVNVE
jgi:tellurium resistance protein TerD